MGEPYRFERESGSVNLLHITDPHLFSNREGQLLGVNTTQSFQAVLDAIGQTSFEYDLILATGDLVQDHNREAYHRFAQMVKPLAKPLFWLEGNHDIQPQMGNALSLYAQIQPQKQILVGKHWQVILLDSHVEGYPYGLLSRSQLDFLNSALSAYPERYSLIALHHNVLPTQSAWLDQHTLRNAEQLAEVLFPFKQVKALLHGHIHQEVDSFWKGYRVLATPSTCIQFKPNCRDFTLDIVPQGWRELTLHADGSITSRVQRLATNDFLPNFFATHY